MKATREELAARADALTDAMRKLLFGDEKAAPTEDEMQALGVVRFTAMTNIMAALMVLHDVDIDYFVDGLKPTLERMWHGVATKIAATATANAAAKEQS